MKKVRYYSHSECRLIKLLHTAGVALILLAAAPFLTSATVPLGFRETLVAGGISAGTAMEFAPDGRLFVCQQNGQLRVIKNMNLLPEPFVTVATTSAGERGLLGVAFDPSFAENQFVYVYYTATSPAIHNRVSRFTARGDTAVPGSEVVVLELENLSANFHNGGAIHFGPDGRLYIATGENVVPSNAQSLGNRLGKILRINPNGSIPTDNPFYNIASGANRSIWALGLRNPFTFAFQPNTGRMFINDVGQDVWEEVNEGRAGANYGWPNCEGACSPSDARFANPVHQYSHSLGPGCAITGGAFYNPVTLQFPFEYRGSYFFADTCGNWINRLDPSNNNAVTQFASGLAGPVDLKVSAEGRLFYLARNRGEVRVIEYTQATRPALGIVREESGLTIVWPVTTEEFFLFSTTTLPGPSTWTSVPNSPIVTNGQNKVRVTSPAPIRFYRLER